MLLQTYQKGKSMIRSIAASLLTGVIVGAIDAVFGRGLLAISDFRTEYFTYLIPFLPIAGLLIVWMYHQFSEISTKGMTLVLEMGQGKRKEIPLLLAPLVLVGTWITHLFGGSAGREGVAVQIGAVVSSQIEQRFHLCGDKKKMLITGMAAGFGGLFQTPLAAVFFCNGGDHGRKNGIWSTFEFSGGSLYRFLYLAFSGTCEVCRADSIRLKYIASPWACFSNSFRCDLWIDRTIFCRIIKVCQRKNELLF